jgi:hypothetical protein
MPTKIKNGRVRVVPTKAKQVSARLSDTEAQISRLFTIALNFNERFVALEMAISRLQNNTATPPSRLGRKKSAA